MQTNKQVSELTEAICSGHGTAEEEVIRLALCKTMNELSGEYVKGVLTQDDALKDSAQGALHLKMTLAIDVMLELRDNWEFAQTKKMKEILNDMTGRLRGLKSMYPIQKKREREETENEQRA